MLLFPALCHDFIEKCDDLLVDLVAAVDRLDHFVLGEFIGARLDHDDFFTGRSHGKSQIRPALQLITRVDDKFTVHVAQLCRRAGAVKRNVGNACRQRTAEHSHHFRIAFRIH